MTLSIHTVFILRENILFMDEWISYHISIGFDKFFLYDNSKSIGERGSTPEINKYNINFKNITNNISDHKLDELLKDFLKKYDNYVTYYLWQPKDVNGNIIYAQNESIEHYIKNYSHLSNWTAFIDIDEFIFSSIKLKEVMRQYDNINSGFVLLFQKKFDDRFNNLDIPVTKIVNCIEGIDTRYWGPKCFIKNKMFDLESKNQWNIHSLPVKDCNLFHADIETIRFHHYNTSTVQLKWMQEFYKTKEEFYLNSTCFSIKNIFDYKIEFPLSINT